MMVENVSCHKACTISQFQIKVLLVNEDGTPVNETVVDKTQLMHYVAAMIPKLKSRFIRVCLIYVLFWSIF